MEIAKLDVQIGADIKPLTAGLDQAKNSLTNFANGTTQAIVPLNQLSNTVVKAGGDMEISARHSIALGRGFESLAQSAAVGTVDVNGLTEVMRVAGTEFTRIQKETGSTAQAFIGLGESLLTPETAIFVIVTALASFISQVDKADKTLTEGEQANKDYADSFDNLNKFIETTKTELGDSLTPLAAAQNAFNELATSVRLLQENYEHLTPVMKELLEKLLPEMASRSVELANAQLEEQQKLNIGLFQLSDERAKHDLEIQKANNAAILSNTKASYAEKFDALKSILNEQKAINQASYDSELQATAGSILKIKTAEENFRFANLQAEQKYNQEYLNLEQKQADDEAKALALRLAAMRAQWEQFNKERSRFSGQIAIETGNPLAPVERSLTKIAGLTINIKKPFADADTVIQEMIDKMPLLKDAVDAISTAFADMFAELITTGKVSIKTLERAIASLIQELVKAVIETAILKIITAALGGGPIGGLGSILTSNGAFPGLAAGGIVSGPTFAHIGENGPEAVIPLDRLQQMIGGLGGSNISISGELRAHGTDLVVALNRGNVRINRNYGQNFTN